MTPERIAELRAVASETPEHGPFGWLTGTGLAGTWHEMLDEIDRLQEANRWRDPAVELPEPGSAVLVWMGPGRGTALVTSDEWPIGPPEMWRPLPDPPQ